MTVSELARGLELPVESVRLALNKGYVRISSDDQIMTALVPGTAQYDHVCAVLARQPKNEAERLLRDLGVRFNHCHRH
jgi:hypothetical protein